nr:hypothetical protein [uncultured Pedobacter sp.]
MIKVKHPLQHCNIMQQEMIAKMPPGERIATEIMFSYGNAAYRYHLVAAEFKPAIEDYRDWVSGLAPALRKPMEELGFEGCLGILSFTRYVNEKNDYGMDEYVKELMGDEDFSTYKKILMGLKS